MVNLRLSFVVLFIVFMYTNSGFAKSSKRVCENKTMRISCSSGRVIQIRRAMYGRYTTSYCGWNIFQGRCNSHSSRSLHEVKLRCQNKRSCSVNAVNGVFGDPCFGTRKYLEVDYYCRNLPVDGGYTKWNIQRCSRTCGGGTKTFTRTCTNPSPKFGGRNCEMLGPATFTEACNSEPCPINGGFSKWGKYGVCSVKCGGGMQSRRRTCTNPSPQYGGLDCTRLGPNSSTRACNEHACPINGGFSKWGKYGVCSVKCGSGMQLRRRTCTNPSPQYGGLDCTRLGPNSSTRACNEHACPINGGFSKWGKYGVCSVKCGGGMQLRKRTCTNPSPQYGGLDCTRLGPSSSTRACNQHACPILLKRVCQDKTLQIKCAPGYIVRIHAALYGRISKGYCGWRFYYSKRCRSHSSVSHTANMCNNKRTCSVSATNKVYGNPCFGTRKYLEVKYSCEPRTTVLQLKRVCQDKTMTINCGKKRIHIKSASYGRTSRRYCGYKIFHQSNCHAKSSSRVVTSRCENKKRCIVKASNKVFGNPCFLTSKYLEVSYTCK
uniref:Cnidarian egg lectin isoform c n=1 Tax=Hydractinia echinata TaxID=3283270 RepID=D3XFH2_HYDEC|nr:cnidarian egg lectin isoform c [Hydractinia echinata]